MSDLIGTVIDGRFEVVRSIGKGGYGDVFEAIQLSVDRRVALKVVHPHLAERSDVSERFRREARLTSRLDHPNAVRVIDFGDDGGLLYLVMDFVQGPTLKDRLKESGTLQPALACEIGAGVAAALHAAHSIGLVHRDLKPSNVILADSADGLRPVVIDFGLVKVFSDEPGTDEVTASHTMIGTPAYMSPENVLGHKVDGRSDLYALGILLYEMLSGERPFSGSSPLETATSRLQGPPPRLSDEHPESLRDLVDDLLTKDPEHRLPSADLALRHLRNWHRVGYTPTRVLERDLTIAPTRGPGASVSGAATEPPPARRSPAPSLAAATDAVPRPIGTKGNGPLLLAAGAALLMIILGIYIGTTPSEDGPGEAPTQQVEVTDQIAETSTTERADEEEALPPEEGTTTPLVEGGSDLAASSATAGSDSADDETATDSPDLGQTDAEPEQGEGETEPQDDEDTDADDRREGDETSEPEEQVEADDADDRDQDRDRDRSRDRDRHEADEPGRLRVNIDPFGDVLVDGESVGGAPQTIELPAGQYTVTTRYLESSRSESVRIRSGATVDVTHRY